ncbi:MAG TPA: TonB-dependent receptor [Steroidobacteraceae bacterium]|nr:TonB-dependent receptor [Steroidobacteraceae bacterium]
MKSNNRLVRLAVLQALTCASGLMLAAPGSASADPARFDITAEPLPNALKHFAAQAKMQLLYRYDVVSHATATPVTGQLEKHAALERLLQGTGLVAVYSDANTATIRAMSAPDKAGTGNKAPGATGNKAVATDPPPTTFMADTNAGSILLAQAGQVAQPAQGTTAASTADEQATLSEVIVVGVRQALATSQEFKKEANTFVDSITATDIGAFPDKSASDALQRIPGITVNRLQSNDDSTHPSGEPTNILIRGLTQVRTEFNGRDTFTSDSARALNFNDISPELLSRADVYKNQTADMIEGGIAGTVDLRTRLPFDQEGHVLVGSVQGDFGSLSNQLTPAYSVLASDSIRTEIGRFGFLVDYSRSHVVTRTESVIDDKMDTYCSSGYGTAAHGIVNADGSIPCTSNVFGGTGWAFAPDGIRYSQVDYDRDRIGSTVATQYENNSKSLLATLQYTDSSYHNAWLEDASHAILDGNYYGTPAFNPRGSSILAGSSGLVFASGSNGMLQSGLLTQPHGSWRGSYSANGQDAIDTGSAVTGVPFVNNCGPGFTCSTLRDGLYFQNETRDFNHNEDTREVSAHVKWDILDRLHTNFDGQFIDSKVVNHDMLVATGSMANYQYSTGSNGVPQVQLLPGSNVNYAPGDLSNPHNYWLPFIQGHEENDGGREAAFAMDAKYDIQAGWLDSLKAGVRYADRNQTTRYSTFNWTPIAASWNCNGPGFNIDNTSPGAYPACAQPHPNFQGYGAGIWGTTNFNGFYSSSAYPNGKLVFMNRSAITNTAAVLQALGGSYTNSPIGGGYTSICNRTGVELGTCFLPSEIEQLEEKTKAGYVMLNFGGPNSDIFGVNVVGNAGVRVVQTKEISAGSVSYPNFTNLAALAPCGTPLGANNVVNPSCYLTPDILAFSNGANGTPNTYTGTHTNALPSFNVRFGLTAKDFIRFAYSRAISRPDVGLLRNYVQINSPFINTGPDSPYVVYNSPTAAHVAANVVGYKFVFNSTAGNAGLLPESADQFDLSYERYFGPTSSLTVGLFYKKLSNTLSEANFTRPFTNNGVTESTQILGPINTKNGGKIEGVEFAYQTFFDFLPGLWNGLGMQVNYTYVNQIDIHNSNLIDAGALTAGGVGSFGAGQEAVGGVVIDSHRLAGVSTNTANVVGLYEKGPIGFRLAYNWRSKYLTDNLDCCIGLPVFQKAAGFLDSSIRYSIGSHVELSFDVTNLLDTKTQYEQQIFGDTSATPGARAVFMDSGWSRVDRRYQFGVRAKL